MSLFRRDQGTSTQSVIPTRVSLGKSVASVSTEDALRQSVLWAALNLRASLVSLMPVDVYRKLPDGSRINISPPPVLVTPDTFADEHPVTIGDWLYASEMSLGLYGNHWGVIRDRGGNGKPARIETIKPSDVVLRIMGTRIVEYLYGGERVAMKDVWHERRHLMPGIPVGLSPVLYAALSIATSASANQLAADWFGGTARPSAVLGYEKPLTPQQTDAAKVRYRETVANGDVLVKGKGWEYTPVAASAAEAGFIEQLGTSARDLVRFAGVPGDMIDVPQDGSAITYANVTQRNTQLMTINMGPALKARDDALTTLTPAPQYVRLNRSAPLAMDDVTRAQVLGSRITSRTLTPTEARRIEDLPPLSDADLAEFDRLFGSKNLQPQKGTTA